MKNTINRRNVLKFSVALPCILKVGAGTVAHAEPVTTAIAVISVVNQALEFFKSGADPQAETISATYSITKQIHSKLNGIEQDVAVLLELVDALPDTIKTQLDTSNDTLQQQRVAAILEEQRENYCGTALGLKSTSTDEDHNQYKNLFTSKSDALLNKLNTERKLLEQRSDLNVTQMINGVMQAVLMSMMSKSQQESNILTYIKGTQNRLLDMQRPDKSDSLFNLIKNGYKQANETRRLIVDTLGGDIWHYNFESDGIGLKHDEHIRTKPSEAATCYALLHNWRGPPYSGPYFGRYEYQYYNYGLETFVETAFSTDPYLKDLSKLKVASDVLPFSAPGSLKKFHTRAQNNYTLDGVFGSFLSSNSTSVYSEYYNDDLRTSKYLLLGHPSRMCHRDIKNNTDTYSAWKKNWRKKEGILDALIKKHNLEVDALATLIKLNEAAVKGHQYLEVLSSKVKNMNNDYSAYHFPKLTTSTQIEKCSPYI